MCLAAIYWARLPRVYFGNLAADATGSASTIHLSIEKLPRHSLTAHRYDSPDARTGLGSISRMGRAPNKIMY